MTLLLWFFTDAIPHVAVSTIDSVGKWHNEAFREFEQEEFLIETVLYKTKLLDGTKPNTNPDPNTNPIQLFCVFRAPPMIFKLATFVRFSHRSNTVLLPW